MHRIFIRYILTVIQATLILTASIPLRRRRGILSKTGICPNPVSNRIIKDTRLNFYGIGYILPEMENLSCSESECGTDHECEADRKCCTNRCGGRVCTEAVREPHPCELFQCPSTKICKVERIQCIDPECPDLYAVARPVCVRGGPIYEMGRKRSRIPSIPSDTYRPTWREIEHEKKSFVHYEPTEPYYKNGQT